MIDRDHSSNRPRPKRIGTDREQELVRSIVACVADGVLVVDDDGIIRFANPAAGDMFGRETEDLVGTEFGFPLAVGHPVEIETIRRGVPITAELRVADMSWSGEHVALVSLRDITERRRSEEAARLLHEERMARESAEQLSQAKSDFLAVMSHELRTPLNAVLGYTQLLDLGVKGPLTGPQREQLQRVTMSARHLLRLVNEILDFSTLEAGKLTVQRGVHGAAAVADMACAVVKPLADRLKLTLNRMYDDRDPRKFLGDPGRTQQILVNLLSNALKFTEPPGTVSLEITDTKGSPSPECPPGFWTGFRVTDSGIGIPESQRDDVFKPFTQLDNGYSRKRDGTGLGLPLSRRLARLMHGDVTLDATGSSGSVFTLWLPARALEGNPD